jgi:hypothetical protein
MDVFLLCVLSGRGFCDELITRPEQSYRLWRVVVCDHETSWYEEAIARAGVQSQRNKQTYIYTSILYMLHRMNNIKISFHYKIIFNYKVHSH